MKSSSVKRRDEVERIAKASRWCQYFITRKKANLLAFCNYFYSLTKYFGNYFQDWW
jgi:hypothetical protein